MVKQIFVYIRFYRQQQKTANVLFFEDITRESTNGVFLLGYLS